MCEQDWDPGRGKSQHGCTSQAACRAGQHPALPGIQQVCFLDCHDSMSKRTVVSKEEMINEDKGGERGLPDKIQHAQLI